MNTNGEELHPNWRALATIHLPLKRFVREGLDAMQQGQANDKSEKYEIQGISGEDVKEFYDEVVKKNESKNQKGHLQRSRITNKNKLERQPFERNLYFRSAMTNNVEELQKMDCQANELNTRDSFGWTALMMAACEGAEKAVYVLLKLGVNKEAKDNAGNTAADLALKKGHQNIVNLLSNFTSKSQYTEKFEINSKEEMTARPVAFYCASCKRNFSQTTQRAHQTSTVHQFNAKSELPINKLQKFNIPPKNRGLQLMVKQGWNKESGLGPEQTGRLYPVKTVIRKQRTGLGIEQPPARVTHIQISAHNKKLKAKTRNDMRREKQREWKRERRLRNELS